MDIDVSKENIQPLRGGRNLVQLGTALQAQSDVEAQRQLQAQKEEHEAAIRNYQGTDPLDPWFNYIQWVEQSYPKHGHEGHIDKLVKDCLQLFENERKYYQDRRFVKLWIKYVDVLSNPLEIYQRLYSTGIGVECSEFYRAWACYCEESGDYKRANQVYMLGLQAKAQPLDELEQAHMNFQLFFAQRMLHDDSPTKRKAASALAETRMALTSLKSFKRRNIANVPVQRVGDSVRSIVPGVVRQQAGNFDNRLPNSNVMVNVYEDAPSTSQATIPVGEDPGPASLVQACSNVENQKEVGIWTNPKTKMVHTNVVPHQPLPFIPYEDQNDTLRLPPNHMPYCMDDLSFTVTLCVPDPPDSTKIPCYNKTQVYVNDQEYSLEEIRSRKYNLKKTVKTEPMENIQMPHNYQNINETLAQCSALETLANCALDSEQDHLGQLMPLAIPSLQNVTKVTNMHSPGEPKVLVNLDSKEFSELSAKKSDEDYKPSSTMSDKENQMMNTSHGNENAPTNYGKNNLMEEFNRSLMGNLLGDSVTVNTKEARWELRNLFNDNEPSIVQPVVQQFEVPNFDIHEDRSMTMAINTKKKGEMTDMGNFPQEKENASKFSAPVASANPQQNVNKTAYYEEPTCTQVFNFNIKDASTPNMSQFKKPTSSCIDQSKFSSVPKFNMDESGIEHHDTGLPKREEISRQHTTDQHATVDNQGTALSVIMEATREYNSKSGSSSSGQSTRTNFTAYTTNYDSMYNNNDAAQPTTSKRNSLSSQPRLLNGQFARIHPQKREIENKAAAPSTSAPYLSYDHQYQKPMPQNYNGFSPQRQLHSHYQQSYNYQHQQNYPNNQMHQQQQGYSSPSPNPYHSPQHPGMQSPHAVGTNVVENQQAGYGAGHPSFQIYQSPQSSQTNYRSPVAPSANIPSEPCKTAYYEEPMCTQVFNFNMKDASTPNMSQFKKPTSCIDQSKFSSVPKFNMDESGIEHHDTGLARREEMSRQHTTDQHATVDNQGTALSVIMEATREYNSKSGSSSSGQSTRTNFTAYTTNYDSMYNNNDAAQPTTSKRNSLSSQPRLLNGQYARIHPQTREIENKAAAPSTSAPYLSHDHQYQKPMPQNYNGFSPQRQLHSHYQQSYNYQHQQNYPNNQMHQQQQGYSSPSPNPYHSPQHPGMQSPHAVGTNVVENLQAGYGAGHPSFQIYQSPQSSQTNYRSPVAPSANIPSEPSIETHMRPESHESTSAEQNAKSNGTPKSSQANKNPSSALRNIRHDQPNVKLGQNSPDIGFSNQYLNFISNRNEPKDNANTPKFTNSPSISQKMHKNLYVSSPEQAQIPPSSGMSDSDSKDGMTARTGTPIQSAKVSHTLDKQKDISKRQLDFEHRAEFMSEDSRDSVSKDSRMSTVYSRPSDLHSDGYGMDVDSENSMECGAFKSTHSISLVETSDIPRPADIDFPKLIDPFNKKLLGSLLEYVKFPNKTHADGYVEVRSVPKMQLAAVISVGNTKLSIDKQLGKGNYGAVFLCLDLHSNKSVAVKYQKPSRPWEFYICQEIKARIKDPFMLPGYMDITTAFLGDNASLFVSEYSKYGSLLDVANKIRAATSKCINEFIVILLTSEMLSIIHYLHKAQIIHADIKPDNFLLMKIPTQEWRTPSLQLIDLGCAIDMSLFPEDTTFRELIATEGFTCTEMREGKPWTYQTDLYCLAGTIHVILMGSYMKVVNRLGQWNIDKKLPRYMKVSLWDKIFTTLLNIPDCNNLPDLMDLKNEVDSVLNEIDNLGFQLRNFANVLKSR